MKLILTLLILSLKLNAQTIVQAENFAKASGVTAVPIDSSITATTNSYADYSVNIPKTTYYSLTLRVLNQVQGSYINLKTPTGKTVLATANLPVSDTWQTVTARARLSATSKSLRLVFNGQSSLNYFTYQQEGISTDNVTKADFDNLKAQVIELRGQLDALNVKFGSLKSKVDTSQIKLSRKVFGYIADSVLTIPVLENVKVFSGTDKIGAHITPNLLYTDDPTPLNVVVDPMPLNRISGPREGDMRVSVDQNRIEKYNGQEWLPVKK